VIVLQLADTFISTLSHLQNSAKKMISHLLPLISLVVLLSLITTSVSFNPPLSLPSSQYFAISTKSALLFPPTRCKRAQINTCQPLHSKFHTSADISTSHPPFHRSSVNRKFFINSITTSIIVPSIFSISPSYANAAASSQDADRYFNSLLLLLRAEESVKQELNLLSTGEAGGAKAGAKRQQHTAYQYN